MPYSMMLDAGHGGRDPGAVYEGRKEADDTLRLTLAVGEILQNHGIDVLYTRTEDVYETPFQKAMERTMREWTSFCLFTVILSRRIIRCREWNLWFTICRV